jgi:hypothetical protein
MLAIPIVFFLFIFYLDIKRVLVIRVFVSDKAFDKRPVRALVGEWHGPYLVLPYVVLEHRKIYFKKRFLSVDNTKICPP